MTHHTPSANTTDLLAGYRMTELGPLPKEWEVVRLGDLLEQGALWIKNGFPQGRFNEQGQGVPHLRPFNVNERGEISLHQIKYVPPPPDNSLYWLRKGDIIFNNTNSEELVGKVAYFEYEGKFVLSNHMTIVRVQDPHVLNDVWLAWWLLHLWHQGFTQTLARRHVNQASISLARLRSIPIPLPPLPEQRAIAHVLRTVQDARKATARVIAALRDLKRSLMRHLFTYGPVPVDAADQVELQDTPAGPIPAHWRVVRLGEVVEVRGGKRLPKGHKFAETRTPYPYLRVTDFRNSSIDTQNLKYLTPEDYEILKRYTISTRDVYISIAGTIGLVGIVPPELDGANLTENAAKLVIIDQHHLLQTYLVYALRSDYCQAQIHQRSTKTSQPKLALTRIRQICLPFPPLDEQREIARILQAVNRKIEAEEARKEALDALFRSLLHHLMTAKIRLPADFIARFANGNTT